MSGQHRRIQLSLVGTLLLGSLAGIYLIIWKRFSKAKPTPATTIIKHQVNTRPDETLKYWTTEKMRAARATDLPHVEAPKQGKEHPRHS